MGNSTPPPSRAPSPPPTSVWLPPAPLRSPPVITNVQFRPIFMSTEGVQTTLTSKEKTPSPPPTLVVSSPVIETTLQIPDWMVTHMQTTRTSKEKTSDSEESDGQKQQSSENEMQSTDNNQAVDTSDSEESESQKQQSSENEMQSTDNNEAVDSSDSEESDSQKQQSLENEMRSTDNNQAVDYLPVKDKEHYRPQKKVLGMKLERIDLEEKANLLQYLSTWKLMSRNMSLKIEKKPYASSQESERQKQQSSENEMRSDNNSETSYRSDSEESDSQKQYSSENEMQSSDNNQAVDSSDSEEGDSQKQQSSENDMETTDSSEAASDSEESDSQKKQRSSENEMQSTKKETSHNLPIKEDYRPQKKDSEKNDFDEERLLKYLSTWRLISRNVPSKDEEKEEESATDIHEKYPYLKRKGLTEEMSKEPVSDEELQEILKKAEELLNKLSVVDMPGNSLTPISCQIVKKISCELRDLPLRTIPALEGLVKLIITKTIGTFGFSQLSRAHAMLCSCLINLRAFSDQGTLDFKRVLFVHCDFFLRNCQNIKESDLKRNPKLGVMFGQSRNFMSFFAHLYMEGIFDMRTLIPCLNRLFVNFEAPQVECFVYVLGVVRDKLLKESIDFPERKILFERLYKELETRSEETTIREKKAIINHLLAKSGIEKKETSRQKIR